jgi:hypothetical protein
MNIFIYSIYYNDDTLKKVPNRLIPLNNSNNNRNDWFEFLPILNYLRNNKLNDNDWYGFLSPKFIDKTGFSSNYIFHVLENFGHVADVALFSSDWDQLSYFLNPWEQGEYWHPGLTAETQKFLDSCNIKIKLEELVTDSTCSVFANYVIAKKTYWDRWKEIAELFFKYAEDPNNNLNFLKVKYGSEDNQYPLKTFIQERFSTLILATEFYKVLTPDQSLEKPIYSRLFEDGINSRRILIALDLIKRLHRKKLDPNILKTYWLLREEIKFKG